MLTVEREIEKVGCSRGYVAAEEIVFSIFQRQFWKTNRDGRNLLSWHAARTPVLDFEEDSVSVQVCFT